MHPTEHFSQERYADTAPAAAWRPLLSLAAHVRACRVGDEVVLMDLARGRYLGIGAGTAAALGEVVADWPGREFGVTRHDTDRNLPPAAERLLHQGLLSTARPTAAAPVLPAPRHSIDVQNDVAGLRTRATDLIEMARAAAGAAWALRFRSIDAQATLIAQQRASGVNKRVDAPSEYLRSSVAAYEKLRPLFFTARDKCLLDTYALLRFLGGRGLFPHGVIGVRTQPFRAHAWVQHGDMVLNDQRENVARFTPILVL